MDYLYRVPVLSLTISSSPTHIAFDIFELAHLSR